MPFGRIPHPRWLQQGHGVNADVVGNDEFQPRQAHPVAGDGREFEGLLGVAHVHQDPGAGGGQIPQLLLLQPEGQRPPVHPPLIALTAAGRDCVAIVDAVGGITGAHDGRDAHLAGNDRRVAGAAPLVGDHAAGALEDRLPVGVGALGHEQIPGAEALDFGGIADHPGRAAVHRSPDRPAPAEHFSAATARPGLQMPTAQHGGRAPRLHGFRSGLEDEQLTAVAVLGPFDVHRCGHPPPGAVVALDRAGPARQLQRLGVADGKAALLVLGHRHCAGGGVGVDHPDRLAAQTPLQDRREALLQGGLENEVFIWVHGALHHGFAQAVGGGEQHRIAKTGLGVDAEHHPRGGQVGPHHPLHANREGHLEVVEAIDLAVGDGPVGEQGGEAAPAGRQQRGFPLHVEVGLLLAGKGGIGQILRRGAGAHRHRQLAPSPQLAVGSCDRLLQIVGQGGMQQQGTGGGAGGLQGGDVVAVQAVEQVVQPLRQPVAGDEVAVGVGAGGEAIGHPHPLAAQLADHLAQGGVLAPHLGDRLKAHLGEGHHQGKAVGGRAVCRGWLKRHGHGGHPTKLWRRLQRVVATVNGMTHWVGCAFGGTVEFHSHFRGFRVPFLPRLGRYRRSGPCHRPADAAHPRPGPGCGGWTCLHGGDE